MFVILGSGVISLEIQFISFQIGFKILNMFTNCTFSLTLHFI